MSEPNHITRNNHYVPRFYLRLWSGNGNTIQVFNGVIKNAAMRGWRNRSIRGTACWSNFYTDTVDGQDDDKFERLLHDYEDATKRVIDKLNGPIVLDESDISTLVQFAIVQAVRTPSFMSFSQELIERTLQPALGEVVKTLEKELDDGSIFERGVALTKNVRPGIRSMLMNIEVDSQIPAVKAETCAGRHNYIAIALRIIEGKVGKLLKSCNWMLLKSPKMLLTSDNPVTFLHIHGGGKWSVGLAEGLINYPTLAYMPVTPHYVLFTRIGCSRQEMESVVLGEDLYRVIQKGTVFNARRYVYGRTQEPCVGAWRPQIVNPDAYDLLDEERINWHQSNAGLEEGFSYLPGFDAL